MTTPVSTPARSLRNWKLKIRLVVERGDDRDDVTGRDPHLGLVVALPDRAGQLRGEAGLEARLEMAIHA